MVPGIQKIQRQSIKQIPGRVGTTTKIKRQKIKQISGTSSVKPKKLPPIKI